MSRAVLQRGAAAAVALLASVGLGQDGSSAIFKKVKRGESFPKLSVTALDGTPHALAVGDRPTVVAFLRPDQADSVAVLADLASMALDSAVDASRLVVIGSKELVVGQWARRWKGTPRRIELWVDAGSARSLAGVIVIPSIAVVDATGRLRSAYVLHDPGLRAWLVRDLVALQSGKPFEADAISARKARDAELSANARRLEQLGRFDGALELRKEQLRLGLRPEAVLLDLGRLSLLLHQPAAALAYYRRSLAMAAGPAARLGVGLALLAAGRLDDAGTALQTALAKNANKVPVHRALCELAEKRGDLDAALAHIKAAIELRSKHQGPAK